MLTVFVYMNEFTDGKMWCLTYISVAKQNLSLLDHL